eukprot:scaffold291765_cov35-Tisochrysis_lutea.AAC.3
MVAPPSPSNSRHHVYSTDVCRTHIPAQQILQWVRFRTRRDCAPFPSHNASARIRQWSHRIRPWLIANRALSTAYITTTIYSIASPVIPQLMGHPPTLNFSLQMRPRRSTLRSGEVSGIAAHNKADIGANLKQVGEQTEVV